MVLLVWGPHSEQHGLGGVTISASPRGCPVARNPALHLLGSLYSLPAAFLRSKISIGLVHSFRHSQSTALPGQALQRRPSGQHLTLEGSQSTRKGWGVTAVRRTRWGWRRQGEHSSCSSGRPQRRAPGPPPCPGPPETQQAARLHFQPSQMLHVPHRDANTCC